MRKTSAFLAALAAGISDDLRDNVDADKLQDEVEKELENQVLSGLVTAVGEYNSARTYFRSDRPKNAAAQNKVRRYLGFVEEMWARTAEVKGALMAGELTDEQAKDAFDTLMQS